MLTIVIGRRVAAFVVDVGDPPGELSKFEREREENKTALKIVEFENTSLGLKTGRQSPGKSVHVP